MFIGLHVLVSSSCYGVYYDCPSGCFYGLWLSSWCWYGCVYIKVWAYSTSSLGYYDTAQVIVLFVVVKLVTVFSLCYHFLLITKDSF